MDIRCLEGRRSASPITGGCKSPLRSAVRSLGVSRDVQVLLESLNDRTVEVDRDDLLPMRQGGEQEQRICVHFWKGLTEKHNSICRPQTVTRDSPLTTQQIVSNPGALSKVGGIISGTCRAGTTPSNPCMSPPREVHRHCCVSAKRTQADVSRDANREACPQPTNARVRLMQQCPPLH